MIGAVLQVRSNHSKKEPKPVLFQIRISDQTDIHSLRLTSVTTEAQTYKVTH